MTELKKKVRDFNARAQKEASALCKEFDTFIEGKIKEGENAYRFEQSIYTSVDGRECEVYGIYYEDGQAVLDMFAPDYITLSMLHWSEAIELISKVLGITF